MKKYLLPNEGNFYKANLHCHTTNSDGKLTPEQVKDAYLKRGYSVIAYTDHDILLDRANLCDQRFLALNGYELEVNEFIPNAPFKKIKTCHMCFIALKPNNLNQVLYHREKYLFGNAPTFRSQLKFDENAPDYERVYSPEGISEMMKAGRDNGFFVTYNHPVWSMETLNEYGGYKNMHAMEIVNNSCLVGGFNDYNEKIYDELLLLGNQIFCTATDDNHNVHPFDSKKCDSFGGFTMIKAPKLEYTAITDALVNGNFYASQGPKINELWFEDGKIHITCEGAESIRLNCGVRRTEVLYAEDKPLTEACFNVLEDDIFVRITVTDKEGKHANTNAYFVKDLLA